MRMMKNKENQIITVIGVDHGYGNMKTACRCFQAGVTRYEKEPTFQNNLLVYQGVYYQIGEEHKEFRAEKRRMRTITSLHLRPLPVSWKVKGGSGKSTSGCRTSADMGEQSERNFP